MAGFLICLVALSSFLCSEALEINLPKATTVAILNTTEPSVAADPTTTTPVTTTLRQILNTTEKNDAGNLTTTAAPTTTTAATTSTSNTTTTALPPSLNPFSGFINRREGSQRAHQCKCDTQVNICEINCCCDLDCSKEVVKLFDCSAEKFEIQEYDYYGNLESCEISGGLLCISSTSLKRTPITFYDSAKKQTSVFPEWLDVFEQSATTERLQSDKYSIGDSLLIFNEKTEAIEKLKLPQKYVGRNCMINEEIKWLKNFESSCIDIEDTEVEWNLFKFLRYPVTASMEFHCTPTSCSNLTINHLNGNYSGDEILPESMTFVVWHNFTHIQGNVELNVTFSSNSSFEIGPSVKKFQVLFKSVEEKNVDSWKTSGSPGYVKEMPLLVAKKVTFTNYTEENKQYVLDFFVFSNQSEPYHANRTFKLPLSQRGKCVITKTEFSQINFGENVNKKCSVHLKSDTYPLQQLNVSRKDVCVEYQRQIFSFLLHGYDVMQSNYTSLLYVSQFGQPKNHSDDWVHLEFKNSPNSDGSDKVDGTWKQDSSDTFTCSNMIINLRFKFYYALLKVNEIDRQNVLNAAELYFGPRLDLQFNSTDISVPIFIQTQFHDVTGGLMNNARTRKVNFICFAFFAVASVLTRNSHK